MKTALVMGINGGFGHYVTEALRQQGWKIRALMRSPEKLPKQFSTVDIITGDAKNIEDVRHAAKGTSLIIYGINPANYDWEQKALTWLDIAASVAEDMRLSLIFPGNVYVLNPLHGPIYKETSPISPVSRKGEIRQAMEERLKKASQNGAQVIILRCGDFIGKHAANSWFQQLIKSSNNTIKITSPGSKDMVHTWAFLPDVAQTVSRISTKLDELPDFSVFHFKGQQFSISDLAQAANQLTGKETRIKNYPWIIIQLIKPFSSLMSGIYEMRYLWHVEIYLDNKKLDTFLGEITPSDLAAILIESQLLNSTT